MGLMRPAGARCARLDRYSTVGGSGARQKTRDIYDTELLPRLRLSCAGTPCSQSLNRPVAFFGALICIQPSTVSGHGHALRYAVEAGFYLDRTCTMPYTVHVSTYADFYVHMMRSNLRTLKVYRLVVSLEDVRIH